MQLDSQEAHGRLIKKIVNHSIVDDCLLPICLLPICRCQHLLMIVSIHPIDLVFVPIGARPIHLIDVVFVPIGARPIHLIDFVCYAKSI